MCCVAMEKEHLEAAEAERAITEFSRKKESLMEHRQHLLKQIDETRQAIQKKRERISAVLSPCVLIAGRTLSGTTGSGNSGIKEWSRVVILGRPPCNET
jgi:hypothetical protein